MKKCFLLTLTMLAVGVTDAHGQETINLGWLACRTAANDASIALNDVTAADFPCATNNSSRDLVVAVNTGSYTTFQGAAIQLDFITRSGVSDWWDVGDQFADPGGCRAGGMVRAIVRSNNTCANPYGDISQLGEETFTASANGPGTYRMVAYHIPVSDSPFIEPAAGGYAAMVITVNSLGTVDDLSGTVLCNGCAVPGSFVLNRVDFAADDELRSFDSVSNTGLRVCVGWRGGVDPGTGFCPGVIPTKNATWGQVKALYR